MKKTLFAMIALAVATCAIQAAPADQKTKTKATKPAKATKAPKPAKKKSAAVTTPAPKAPAATPSR